MAVLGVTIVSLLAITIMPTLAGLFSMATLPLGYSGALISLTVLGVILFSAILQPLALTSRMKA